MIESADVPVLIFGVFFVVYSLCALVTGIRAERNNQEMTDHDTDDNLPALMRQQAE